MQYRMCHIGFWANNRSLLACRGRGRAHDWREAAIFRLLAGRKEEAPSVNFSAATVPIINRSLSALLHTLLNNGLV